MNISIRISGKVQGVFFRASTKAKADELNIKGFVRNEKNGDVYIEAEGDDNTLSEFISWCKHGPTMARVDQCEVAEEKENSFSTFMILH